MNAEDYKLIQVRAELERVKSQLQIAERDRERLLNVLEHCALPEPLRPKCQHDVAAMVVKEYRSK